MGLALTRPELEELARGSREIVKVLGRAPGAPLSPIQKVRAQRCYELMMSAQARPGELWAIAIGDRDFELNLPSGSGHTNPPRTSCLDCSANISDPAARFRSDPARCKKCRKLKKERYNVANRGRK